MRDGQGECVVIEGGKLMDNDYSIAGSSATSHAKKDSLAVIPWSL